MSWFSRSLGLTAITISGKYATPGMRDDLLCILPPEPSLQSAVRQERNSAAALLRRCAKSRVCSTGDECGKCVGTPAGGSCSQIYRCQISRGQRFVDLPGQVAPVTHQFPQAVIDFRCEAEE
jgi:hypothetical protein